MNKSLKINAVANFIGRIYSAILGVFVLPFYLRYLGAEAYGLVSFFSVLNIWLHLLDMGLSPTLSREIAATRGGTSTFTEFRKLLRSVEFIFFFLGISIAGIIFYFKHYLASNWLQINSLLHSDVATCISLMGLMVGARWFTSLYSSGITGMEDQVWINVFNCCFATVKFLGAYFLLRYISSDVVLFFQFQVLLCFLELFLISTKFYRILPGDSASFQFELKPLQRIAPFAGGIAFATVVWTVASQLDKLLLSHLLPLKEFGYFSLATMVASIASTMTAPINQALLPRMTLLVSQNRKEEMLRLYCKASQITSSLILPFVLTIAGFSKDLLFFWTGDLTAAEYAGPVLTWYVLGNGILALVAYQYFLQFAHGKVKLHVISNIAMFFAIIPSVYFSVNLWGAVGAGFAWFCLNFLLFIFYVPIVHLVFAPNLHFKWLYRDVLQPLFASIVFVELARWSFPRISTLPRALGFITLLWLGFIALLATCSCSKECRAQFKIVLQGLIARQ